MAIPFRKKSTPQRQNTGAKRRAAGAVDPAKTAASILEQGSQVGSTITDPIPQLTGQQAAITYRKMVRADASVRVSLRAGKAPVLGADYYVDPYDDSEESALIAQFVTYNLFNGMTTPFKRVIEQALKMYEDGYSVFENVWELREWSPDIPNTQRRKFTMLRKLAVRPVSTITEIEYDDNGGPQSITQQAQRANGRSDKVTIPIEKLVIFTFDQDGGDIRGNSILRSAYQHWYYKDHLYKIDAVQKERHGLGIPFCEVQVGASAADKKLAHQVLRNVRTNEKAYIVSTPNLKFGFVELTTQLTNALESASHHDNMIMKNVMVQFLNLGMETSGGGRATGATSMDMFLKAMRYIAETYICGNINMYLIPQMVAYNFNTDKFPTLKVRNVGEVKDLQMWAAAMANLKKQGLLQIDDETEQWIRQQMDMPKRQSAFITSPTSTTSTPSNGNGKGVTTGNVGKSESSGAT